MADATRELKIVVGAETAGAEQKISGFGDTLKNVGTIAAGFLSAQLVTKGFEMIKDSVMDSVKAFQESENVMAQTNAVLASTHGAAKMTATAISEMASELQDASTFSDEEIQSGENLLLTFTKIGKDVFPQATQAILDMSQSLGQDMKSSAIQLGKALNDPITGITALRRVGVAFTEQQKDQIKSLVEHGKLLDAQKIILKELNTEFGGSAVKAAMTYEGKMKILKNQLNDVQEAMGKMILDAIYPFVDGIGLIIDAFRQYFVFGNKMADSVEELKTRFPGLIQTVQFLVNAFNFLKTSIQTTTDFMITTWKQMEPVLMPVVQGMTTRLMELFKVLQPFFQQLMTGVLAIVGGALAFLYVVFNNNWANIVDLTSATFQLIGSVINLALDIIIGILKIFGDIFSGNWKKLWIDLKDFFSKIWNDIKNIFKAAGDFIMGILNTMAQMIDNVLSGVGKVSKESKSIQGRASGGFASGLTLVGEHGPEYVSLPAGSYVHNAPATDRMGGGGNTVIINNPSVRSDRDISAIADAVKRALGRESELARMAVS